jgi:hypothetical protein
MDPMNPAATAVADPSAASSPQPLGAPSKLLEAKGLDPTEAQSTGPAGEDYPTRPAVDAKIASWVQDWWKKTNDLPQKVIATKGARACTQILFPAWWDPEDPWAGRKPRELRDGEDDRRVNAPIAYLNVQQTVAMTVPQNHRARWRPEETMEDDLGGDPFLKKYGKGLGLVVRTYLRESDFQNRLESWVFNGSAYPIGIVKVNYSRELQKDAIRNGGRNDEQALLARIRVLAEDLAAGRLHELSPEMVELKKLWQTVIDKNEIVMMESLVVQTIELERWGFDGRITKLEDVYDADFMYHDIDMPIDKIRELYPYKVVENPDAPTKPAFTGVHPDDLHRMQNQDRSKLYREGAANREQEVANYSGTTASTNTAASPNAKLRNTLLVREVECKADRKVYVFIEGLDYPALSYTPDNPPEQWYSYVVLVPNEVPKSVYGISDVELIGDEQHAVNRKRTDAERYRYEAMPRRFYNSSLMDEKQAQAALTVGPWKWNALPLPVNMKMGDVMMQFEVAVRPETFEIESNMQQIQRGSRQPDSMNGVTGTAHFAAEVNVAAQGTSIQSKFRAGRITRALERFYTVVAQILIQVVTPEQAREIAGEKCPWPIIYGEEDAKAKLREIKQQAIHESMPEFMAAVPRDPVTGAPQIPAPEQIKAGVDAIIGPKVEQKCIEVYGFPEPLSREGLFKRLKVRVSIAMDQQLDAQQRMQEMNQVFQAMAGAVQACQLAGIQLNVKPFVKRICKILDDDDLEEEMFTEDPNKAGAVLLQALMAGQPVDPELELQLFKTIQPLIPQIVAQLQQQQAAAAPGPGGKPVAKGGKVAGPGAAPPPAGAGLPADDGGKAVNESAPSATPSISPNGAGMAA